MCFHGETEKLIENNGDRVFNLNNYIITKEKVLIKDFKVTWHIRCFHKNGL